MGTLLKYEFRRSRVIFLGIIGVTLLVELLYLVGLPCCVIQKGNARISLCG